MPDGDILLLKAHEICSLLQGRETELIEIVSRAYQVHALGDSSLPHSTFLRFPNNQRDRIIGLPAYLGQEWQVAGIKWIASFPDNITMGLERASALVILNSTETGRPEAILEGSLVSARRTAASAALGAKWLRQGDAESPIGVIGCGLISFEIVRFLLALWPESRRFVLYDLSQERAEAFKQKCRQTFGPVTVAVAEDIETVLRSCPLISIATTATTPHIADVSACSPGTAILHISLRDLSPEVILACDNVVDDTDHVCRAQTSVHLAQQLVGHHDFIRCTLADIVTGRAPARKDSQGIAVFSPFGLGVLDLAVSKYVRDLAVEQRLGTTISSFLPQPQAENG